MNKKSNIYLLLIFIFSFCSEILAQTTTHSPYSNFGIGMLRDDAYIQSYSMGNTATALRPRFNINTSNPASYSSLVLTTFETGATYANTYAESTTETQYTNNAYLRYLALGFPVADYWGMSFGLVPYSSVGYNYENTSAHIMGDSVDYTYEGSGGINQFYIGNSFAFNLDSSQILAIGFNASYLFGSMYYEERIIFPDQADYFNTWNRQATRVGDFYFDFGLQYRRELDDDYSMTFGATYAYDDDINASTTRVVQTYTGPVDTETIKDTAFLVDEVADSISIPQTLGFGLSLEKKNHWMVGLDFEMQDWSNTAFRNNGKLTDRYALSAGFQYIPDYKDITKFWNMVRYRIGGRYEKTYLSINETAINELGITFGFGLPLKKTFSTLNLGFELGSRGTSEQSLVLERFGNISFGLVINDKWFIKRKYD